MYVSRRLEGKEEEIVALREAVHEQRLRVLDTKHEFREVCGFFSHSIMDACLLKTSLLCISTYIIHLVIHPFISPLFHLSVRNPSIYEPIYLFIYPSILNSSSLSLKREQKESKYQRELTDLRYKMVCMERDAGGIELTQKRVKDLEKLWRDAEKRERELENKIKVLVVLYGAHRTQGSLCYKFYYHWYSNS